MQRLAIILITDMQCFKENFININDKCRLHNIERSSLAFEISHNGAMFNKSCLLNSYLNEKYTMD